MIRQFKKIIFLIGLLVHHVIGNSQDSNYVHHVIDVLSHDSMLGRGYVDQGHLKAAHFIAKEFKKNGLRPIGESYFLPFEMTANTFPGKVHVVAHNGEDSLLLKPGTDVWIAPNSPGGKGDYQIEMISWEEIEQETWLEKIKGKTNYFLGVHLPPDSLDNKRKMVLNSTIYSLANISNAPWHGVLKIANTAPAWSGATELGQMNQFTVLVPKSFSIDRITFEVEQAFDTLISNNVVGVIEGNKKNKYIFVTAHYDHLGKMGPVTFNGAFDNATGTATILDMARYWAQSEEKPKYTLVFVAFGGEEFGLLGSRYMADHPPVPLKRIKFLLNIDLMYRPQVGIRVVNGSIFRDEFDQMVQLNEENNYVDKVRIRGESCNSDHCPFYMKGVPSFFIYTLGQYPYYHNSKDVASEIQLDGYNGYFKLMNQFLREI